MNTTFLYKILKYLQIFHTWVQIEGIVLNFSISIFYFKIPAFKILPK